MSPLRLSAPSCHRVGPLRLSAPSRPILSLPASLPCRWEIWTLGTTPYEDKKVPQVLQGVMSGTLRPGVPHDCDPGWADLMQQCWHPRASMRPSFSDICRALETLLDAAAAD